MCGQSGIGDGVHVTAAVLELTGEQSDSAMSIPRFNGSPFHMHELS